MPPLAPFEAGCAAELLGRLRGRPYFLRGKHGDQDWIVVHAGVVPRRRVEDTPVEQLVRLRRLKGVRGEPFWYEVHPGPELVFFGHTSSTIPCRCTSRGRLVALGLDTGCVYGGSLTAFRVEDGEFATVAAKRRYVG
ncbi:MAG: hypothetical protein H8E31_11225 [Planctomycetes bacterium]|nr:hypothetical protein [Planctomycetota bacterium]